ncbi:hypothetical protein D9615_009440 [Tricholomella constricta]|uniref:Peptidase A1 domain-containing protein n=1 Tax=Tricholomella constricta TaxID=117010 RepID=A0A8H5GYJ2_9AGAR|nr:hypothetical protein D9615_009440 [Tricholomella constricta]
MIPFRPFPRELYALSAGLVLLALHDVNADPAGSPCISIPISCIGPRTDVLPSAHIQKRYYHPGLDLHRLSRTGKRAPASPVSNAQARPATLKANSDVRRAGDRPGRKPNFPHAIALDIQSNEKAPRAARMTIRGTTLKLKVVYIPHFHPPPIHPGSGTVVNLQGALKDRILTYTPSDYIPFDGLAGFAQSAVSRQGTITPLAIVSYHIHRLAVGHNYSELTLGALNPARYRAETLVQVRNISPIGLWETRVDSVRVGGKDMRCRNWTAIFDTGSKLTWADPRRRSSWHRKRTTPTWTASAPGPSAPSTSKKPVFAPTLDGRAFNVDARDIVFLPLDKADPQGNCTSGITAGNIGGAEQWLVGDVLRKSDIGGRKRCDIRRGLPPSTLLTSYLHRLLIQVAFYFFSSYPLLCCFQQGPTTATPTRTPRRKIFKSRDARRKPQDPRPKTQDATFKIKIQAQECDV